ncbi:MAG: SusD/RagB family nutrient-binding outer membrane lipoprotein [Sphingobacteriales bacterium]|nr:MAG: SusD/RagB family nutrient-binding outer membrane lipoprotein [Sphingobacteriales bacterium]
MTSGNQNPLHSEMVGLNYTQNIVASRTVVDSMNNNNDYRAYALFTYQSTGLVVGIPQGAYNVSASTAVSIPTAYTGARALDDNSAAAPVRFISSYESMFLQAEAVARGFAAGDDETLFNEGVRLNFEAMDASFQEEIGVTAAEALDIYLNGDTSVPAPPAYWGQYPTTGDAEAKLRHIITQKWFSMTGTQGFEAWTEWRRTGYPKFFVVSANSLIGSQLPVRFLYPDVEQTTNLSFPGQAFVTEKVWWDVKD